MSTTIALETPFARIAHAALVTSILLSLMLLAAPARASACAIYSGAYNVPQGYGAAFNVFSPMRELLLSAECGVNGFTARSGSSQASTGNTAILTTGYRWDGTTWSSFSWVPNGGTLSGNYVIGGAQSSSELAYQGDYTYWTSFTCVLHTGTWKCGCRDAYCQTTYWNLQVVAPGSLRSPDQLPFGL